MNQPTTKFSSTNHVIICLFSSLLHQSGFQAFLSPLFVQVSMQPVGFETPGVPVATMGPTSNSWRSERPPRFEDLVQNKPTCHLILNWNVAMIYLFVCFFYCEMDWILKDTFLCLQCLTTMKRTTKKKQKKKDQHRTVSETAAAYIFQDLPESIDQVLDLRLAMILGVKEREEISKPGTEKMFSAASTECQTSWENLSPIWCKCGTLP